MAYVNIGCYYIVGIPIGYVLGFTYDMGAKSTIIAITPFGFLSD